MLMEPQPLFSPVSKVRLRHFKWPSQLRRKKWRLILGLSTQRALLICGSVGFLPCTYEACPGGGQLMPLDLTNVSKCLAINVGAELPIKSHI